MSHTKQTWNDNIWYAIEKENVEFVQRHLRNQAEFRRLRHISGYTLLGYAAVCGTVKIINFLTMEGLDLCEVGETEGARMPLSLASFKGHIEAVKTLTDKISNINLTDPDGNTALANAARAGHIKVIDWLMVEGADVSKFDDKGSTPLSCAVKGGHWESVKLLLSKGANINQIDSEGNTPLVYAVQSGNITMAEYLSAEGATGDKAKIEEASSIDPRLLRLLKSLAVKGAMSMLFPTVIVPLAKIAWNGSVKVVKHVATINKVGIPSAAAEGDLDRLKFLFSNGADVNELDSDGNTALANSAKSGNSAIVGFLIDNRANVSKFEKPGKPPLTWAAQMGHLEVVRVLLKKGANVNQVDSDGNTPLTNAILSDIDNTAVIEYLISEDADVCKFLNNGTPPLSVAAQKGNINLVKYLLSNGAKPTIRTAFMEAIRSRNFELVKYMVEYGVSVNFIDRKEFSPLKLAIEMGDMEIARYLITNAAISEDNRHKSALLMKHLKEKNFDMVEFLVDIGANLGTKDEYGYTPLTRAVEIESLKMVKYLVEQGAKINQFDGNDKTGLYIAAEKSSFQIATFLIDSGADVEVAKTEVEKFTHRNADFERYLKKVDS